MLWTAYRLLHMAVCCLDMCVFYSTMIELCAPIVKTSGNAGIGMTAMML